VDVVFCEELASNDGKSKELSLISVFPYNKAVISWAVN